MTVVIRQARLNEARSIAKVHLDSWNEAYQGVYPDWFIRERPFEYRHGMWVAYLKDDQRAAAVAEADGKLCGLVRYGRPENIGEHDAGTGEVHQLYVLTEHQNRGVGAQLLAQAEAELVRSGFTSASLWVTQGKDRSLAFYERQGWAQRGDVQHIDFGGFEIPLLEMVKQLAR